MCGIAGILDFKNKQVDKNTVAKMTAIQKHRGPDDEGFYFDGNIGLGHRRLSIIDLTDFAHQPMSNEDGTKWIIFNGEIYNYLEITDELAGLGHVFKSKSDTEVIIHAIEEWGEDALSKMNGMWAFALWDRKERSLLCSRDRFGIKPFYYFLDDNRFVFASEIKGVLAVPGVPRMPDDAAIYAYLARGYGYVDVGENTFFKGIKQLKPGHVLRVSSDKRDYKRYWQLDISPDKRIKNTADAVDKFGHLFKDAVKMTMRSDVPVGISLSGGLDSTSIAMLMPEFTNNKIKSFSAYFREEGFDEKKFIDAVIKGNVFEPFFISPDPKTLVKEFEDIIWHQDEPYSGASVFSQWEVMKKTRSEKIKVLLTGQGGDEVLAGYYKLLPYFIADLVKDFKVKTLFKNAAAFSCGNDYPLSRILLDTVKIFASKMAPANIKMTWKAFKKPEYLDEGFFSRFCCGLPGAGRKIPGNFIDRELYDSLFISPLPGLLHVDDRNSMANSVESRPPLLDFRLVEFAASIPYDLKIQNGFTKYILREAMKGKLPEEVRLRRDKMGFVTPAKLWFRNELKDYIHGILGSDSFKKRGIFDINGVRKILHAHFEGKNDHSFTIWSWLNLELWFRAFIDGSEIAE